MRVEAPAPIDWASIDLVVFDVDGTLYDQSRLRLRMLGEMINVAWRRRTVRHLRIVRAFRQCREKLAHRPAGPFEELQYELTAKKCGVSQQEVRDTVAEWIERRPLAFLHGCRVKGVDAVFAGLAAAGKTTAVFSDYGPHEKLDALRLPVRIVVSADDADVARLKPSPEGLCKILAKTRIPANRALMIGDRFERDWLAARAIGMPCLIRSSQPDPRSPTFRDFTDPRFHIPGRSN